MTSHNPQAGTRKTTDSAVIFLLVLLPLFIVGLVNARGPWLYVAIAAMLAYVGAMIWSVVRLSKRGSRDVRES